MPLQFEEMTVAELKEALKERGLVRSGNKSELIQRLVEHETPNTNESTEGNVEFDCPNCRSRLQIPASFEGSIICPTCSTKIDNALAKKQQSPGFTMTQNQISLAVSISGLVLGLVAIIVFFSAFTADAMCPEEDRNTIIVDGEETWTCDSDEFLWETKTTSRLFYSCCLMIPGSMFLTSLGYSMREKPEGEVFFVNAEGVMQVSQKSTSPSGQNQENFSDSKVANALQAAAMYFGIGMYAMVMIAGIILAILFFALIYLILFEY